MTKDTADKVSAAATLFALADSARSEAMLWTDTDTIAQLNGHAHQLDECARVALGDDEQGRAFIVAGRNMLRAFACIRRFIEQLELPRELRAYITFDCRDGRHAACATCGCRCHDEDR